ncbi:CLUMA_CG008953, isoform A [Clunio marinus]|uniref:CLUMA_CG008953, isoform A n=1 Tax=Clunio marinus TaxID=568069 RepID=A0A1J1I7C8_9DIPT|nr:CLUMA_CG008953, isoform A [Clunio marinus]
MKTKALVFGLLACSGVGLAGYQLYKTYLKTMEKDEVEDQKERTEKEEDEYIEDNDYQPGEFERIMNEWEVDNEPFWKRRSFPSNEFDLDLWQPIAEEDEEDYEEDESYEEEAEEDESYETCEESEEESYETCQEYEDEGDLNKQEKAEMKTKALVFGLLACSGVGLAGYQLYKTYLKTMEKDEVEDQEEITEVEEDEYIEDNDYQPGEFERIMNEWEVDNEPFWKRRSFPSNGFDLDLWQPIAEEDEENYEEDESEEDETYETCQEYENEGDLIKDWVVYNRSV